MAKQKDPDLADWEVFTASPGMTCTVRASHLRTPPGGVVLESAGGQPLFAAIGTGVVVRRVSDEDREARRAAAAEKLAARQSEHETLPALPRRRGPKAQL